AARAPAPPPAPTCNPPTQKHKKNPAVACSPLGSERSILSAQAGTLIGPETGIQTIAALHSQCRSWVKLGSWVTSGLGPFIPRQRTCSDCIGMSVSCQQETHAPQQTGSLFD